jgi:hypothetical protein
MVRLNIVEHKYFLTEEDMRKEYPNAKFEIQNYFGEEIYGIHQYNQEQEDKIYELENTEVELNNYENGLNICRKTK